MLSNRNVLFILTFLLFILTSCEDKNSGDGGEIQSITNPALQFLQENYKPNIKWAEQGEFLQPGKEYIAAMEEIDSGSIWGVKFYLFDETIKPVLPLFVTATYDGSLEGSRVRKITINNSIFLWYDSGDYFLGTSGGEEYIYVADFRERKVVAAHIIIEPETDAKLFISPDAETGIRDFIISEVRKDYPDLRIIRRDIKID